MRKLILLTALLTSFAGFVTAQCSIYYVTVDGAEDASGTIEDPLAIEIAFSDAVDGDVIRIATGEYALDAPLEIAGNNIVVEGGFIAEEDWTKTSVAGATTLYRSTNAPEGALNQQRLVALSISDKTGFELHDLTIRTADANLPGMSTYGVYLSNCSSYRFVRCIIEAGNAADGESGLVGDAGEPGEQGITGGNGSCNGGECTFGNGQAGGAGGSGGLGGGAVAAGSGAGSNNGQQDNGVAGTDASGRNGGGGGGGGAGGDECSTNNAGLGGAGGASACNSGANGGSPGAQGDPGGDGGTGNPGINGVAGSIGEAGLPGGEDAGFWIPGSQAGTGGDGCGGAGGGGGGGSGRQTCTFCDNGPGNGGSGGGGGGQGGIGGTGGFGGGSSFGVYTRQNGAGSAFIDCRVIAGNQGFGGAGGQGGAGGEGGAGGAANGSCSGEIGTGGAGGKGGNGGAGGNGGDGAMGISSAVELASGEAYTVLSTNYNLEAQPEVKLSYTECMTPQSVVVIENLDLSQGENVTTWNFGMNANPVSGVANPQEVTFLQSGFFNIVNGTNTYRAFAYYCCGDFAGVEDLDPIDRIMVYPNPTSGTITMELPESIDNAVVQITDVSGRVWIDTEINNKTNPQFDVQGAAGIYFIKIKTGEKERIIKLVRK